MTEESEIEEGEITELEVASAYPKQRLLFEKGIEGVVLKPGNHSVRIGDWFSPLEFHVLFLAFDPFMIKMQEEMNELYDRDGDNIKAVECIEGTPCCVTDREGVWHRAEVQFSCGDRMSVFLVDVGKNLCIINENVKVLREEYAVYPPMAVKCTLKDCHPDICYRDILDRIRNFCHDGAPMKLFFVEFADKLSVELYDGNDRNVFEEFFGELLRKRRIAAEQRMRDKAKKRRPKTDSSEDEDFYWSEDDLP